MNRTRAVIALATLSLAATGSLLLAGPLNPPHGPVASTMKTLTEVEPRIAINATNTPGDAMAMAVITQPGSYYLTSDLVTTGSKWGIRVLASDATIDLNGMSIRRGEGATGARGITDDADSENAPQTIRVQNGTITGFSSSNTGGVYCSGNTALSVRDLVVTNCESGVNNENGSILATNVHASGISSTNGLGLRGNDGSTFVACDARSFGRGFETSGGLVRSCTAYGCGTGIDATRSRVEGCVVSTSSSGAIGVRASAYSAIVGCIFSVMEVGVRIESLGVLVEDCTFSSSSHGVQVFANEAVIQRNVFKIISTAANNGTCIKTEASATRAMIRDNQASNFNFGIVLNAAGSTVTGNRFGNPISSATAIYSFPTGTRHGPVIKSVGSSAPVTVGSNSAVSAPSTMGSSDPDANFYW